MEALVIIVILGWFVWHLRGFHSLYDRFNNTDTASEKEALNAEVQQYRWYLEMKRQRHKGGTSMFSHPSWDICHKKFESADRWNAENNRTIGFRPFQSDWYYREDSDADAQPSN